MKKYFVYTFYCVSLTYQTKRKMENVIYYLENGVKYYATDPVNLKEAFTKEKNKALVFGVKDNLEMKISYYSAVCGKEFKSESV